MAQLTRQTVKDYLRVQHSAQDTLIDALIAAAYGAIDAWLGRPVYLADKTFHIDTFQPLAATPYAHALQLGMSPVDSITSIADGDEAEVAIDDVQLRPGFGSIILRSGGRFDNPPYTVVAMVGLEVYEEFEERIEPVINQAALDIVADLFQRRNPAARSEREGGGVGVDYDNQIRPVGADSKREDLIPPRTAALLAPWRKIGV